MTHLTTIPDLWPYAKEAYQHGITLPKYNPNSRRIFYQDTHQNGLTGFIGLLPITKTKWRITTWYVRPQHRNQGHGTHLHQRALNHATEHGATHIELRTKHLWLAYTFGYHPTGKTHGQYTEYRRLT